MYHSQAATPYIDSRHDRPKMPLSKATLPAFGGFARGES
jgi:hypothetical protein